MAAKSEMAGRFFFISEMNTHSLLLSHSVQTGPGRFVPNWHPNRAILRHLPPSYNRGFKGGDFNRTVNYVWAVRAKSHYQAAVPWFGTEFFYLNLKLT